VAAAGAAQAVVGRELEARGEKARARGIRSRGAAMPAFCHHTFSPEVLLSQ
jgi:hypothetical protein